ncbi:MAG TPA: methyltransferase domain-containing protein [Steroidobacteraceae bacterium]|nr:methyltransferase domain-containing protein [Steroidobacteraceae bacterium]
MSLQERTAGAGLHEHAAARVQQIEPRRDARIVDLGCGTGAFLARLNARGYVNLTGIDICPPRSTAQISFLAADLDQLKLDLGDSSVDLFSAIEVFEHVENIGSLLDEISRLLRPGGKLFITTPNVHSLEARTRFFLADNLKQFDAKGDPTHVMPLFLFTFRRIVAGHGLSIIDSWGFPEDGSSPTSRGTLRVFVKALRLLGLKDSPAGDNLCLLLEKCARGAGELPETKARRLTAHY